MDAIHNDITTSTTSLSSTSTSNFQVQAEVLLSSLKDVIDKQQSHNVDLQATVDRLSLQVNELLLKNKYLDEKVELLEKELNHERAMSRRHKRKVSLSRKLSASSIDEVPHQQSSKSNSSICVAEGTPPPQQRSTSVSRSSSFQRKHLEEQDVSAKGNHYELSSDLKDRQIEAIRNFYGGERSEGAARVIQYAFRKYQMRKNFLKIRQPSTRRRLTIDSIKEIDLVAAKNQQKDKSYMSDTECSYETMRCPSVTRTPPPSPRNEPAATNSGGHTEEDKANEDSTTVAEDTSTSTLNAAADALETLENALVEVVQEEEEHQQQQDVEDQVTQPPSEDEIVKRILSNDPVMPYMDPNSQAYRSRKQRKRHGYETVAEISDEPPITPTTPTIITSFSSVDSNKDEPPLTPTTLQPPADAHGNNNSRSRSDLMSIPELSAVGSSLSGGQQQTTRQQQQTAPVARTNSDNSLHSAEMDGDRESIKSYDTSSITSEISATSTSVSASGTDQSGYHRRSTVSRESWHVDNDVLRKRLYRIGLNLFNRKPVKGLEFLIEKQFVVRTPPAIANFLLNRKGLSRQMVGEYLGNPQPYCRDVLDAVCELMDFSDMDIDQALRSFQSQIRVQGEAQKVERLIEAFSQRYCTCNPERLQSYKNPDAIFIVAYAIIMLNTDLHSPNMKNERRMTSASFIKNLRGIDNGDDLDEAMLGNVYARIKESELITLDDHVTQVLSVENNIIGKKPTLAVPHRRLVCYCRLFQVPDPNKPQKSGLHQREVFLFNDMIMITKLLQKKKIGTTYTFKQSLPLHGLSFLLFETPHYPNGVRLVNAMDSKSLMAFNAPNETDRSKFVTDLREAIAEVEQMEGMRIGAELEKAHSSGMSPSGSRRSSLSLVDTKKISSSMQNLNANGALNIKSSALTGVPGSNNMRPTSMYAMGGVNVNNNNNNNNNNNKPAAVQAAKNSSSNNNRLPTVIGNLLGSGKHNPRRFLNRASAPSLNTLALNHNHDSSPGGARKHASSFHKVASQQQVFIPQSEV